MFFKIFRWYLLTNINSRSRLHVPTVLQIDPPYFYPLFCGGLSQLVAKTKERIPVLRETPIPTLVCGKELYNGHSLRRFGPCPFNLPLIGAEIGVECLIPAMPKFTRCRYSKNNISMRMFGSGNWTYLKVLPIAIRYISIDGIEVGSSRLKLFLTPKFSVFRLMPSGEGRLVFLGNILHPLLHLCKRRRAGPPSREDHHWRIRCDEAQMADFLGFFGDTK